MPDELESLNKQIRELTAEKQKLEAIKDAKIQIVKLKIARIPSSIQAAHPFLSRALGAIGRGSVRVAKSAAHGTEKLADYLIEQQRKEEEHQARMKKLAYA